MRKEEIECKCPFCERELIGGCFEPLFCQPCQVKFVVCKKCGKMYNEKLEGCPECREKHGY